MKLSLPKRLEDISQFRQVPDHQEVFADASTDQSVVVEIVQYDSDVSNERASTYYFDDLADCNSAITSTVNQKGSVSSLASSMGADCSQLL